MGPSSVTTLPVQKAINTLLPLEYAAVYLEGKPVKLGLFMNNRDITHTHKKVTFTLPIK